MVITDSQKWFVLAVLVFLGWLLYLLAPILTPFVLGALFAYLGDPVADRLEDKGLSRSWAVITVFIGMTLIMVFTLLLILPLLQNQLAALISDLPAYMNIIAEVVVPWITAKTGISWEHMDMQSISRLITDNWSQAGGVAANVIGYISRSGTAVLAWIANLVLIPVVTFYLLRDWDGLIDRIDHLIPRKLEPAVARVAVEADEMLGAFLRGQMMVMISLGTIYSVGLWLVGVKYALLIGMLAGLVSFVPYLGFLVGIVVASVAVMFQTQDLVQLVPVAVVFTIGQMMEGMLLTPMLVGDRIGLHPVIVIFAVLAGGQLFGFAGILVALPVSAVIAVIVRDLHRRYLDSAIYAAEHSEVELTEAE